MLIGNFKVSSPGFLEIWSTPVVPNDLTEVAQRWEKKEKKIKEEWKIKKNNPKEKKKRKALKTFIPTENAGHELSVASIYCRHFCHFTASKYQLHWTEAKFTFYSNKLQILSFQLYSKTCIADNLRTTRLTLGNFLIVQLDWFITDINVGTHAVSI